MPPPGWTRTSTPKARVAPSTPDLHWAAGFIEGEGCFTTSPGSQRVVVGQTQREPLERLAELFGGSVVPMKQKGLGKKPMFKWAVYGSRARGVSWTLYPLLSTARQTQIRKVA